MHTNKTMKELATLAEFHEAIRSGIVIIDFTAKWCGPCKSVAPKFEALSKELTTVAFYKVDVDEANQIAEMSNVTAMPTFHIYRDGKRVGEVVGADINAVKNRLQQAMMP